jgi:hypothetical protein
VLSLPFAVPHPPDETDSVRLPNAESLGSGTPGLSAARAYQIMRLLPATEGEFQYVIRSANENHERVARESELSRY